MSESAGRRRVTVCIGMTQLINWGTAFYLPGVFCAAIAAVALLNGLGWRWGVGQVCDRGVLMFSFGVACLITLTTLLLYLTRQRAAQSAVLSDE
ncbi:hypothetical protein OHJ28_05470 [Dickeya fangzhongdai]|uniref:hypothetical protein n=1 Tax=Dickeya fangzhongdai TaxID=1778540 RepID=UPI0033073D53